MHTDRATLSCDNTSNSQTKGGQTKSGY